MLKFCSKAIRHSFSNFNASKDYYKILNISTSASKQQIKKSFLKLAKVYHPDANKGNEQKFKEINQAYQVLSSDLNKKDYDQSRSGRSSASGSQSGQGYSNPYQNFNQGKRNTYRGYQRQTGWNDKQYREQTIHQMFREQNQNFNNLNQQHRMNVKDFEEVLKSRSKSGFRNVSPQEMNEMLRQNMEYVKITQERVKKAYEEEQKRREKQFQQYRQKRQKQLVNQFKGKAYKMAEGLRDNVQGAIKVGQFVKQNLKQVAKGVGVLKNLWSSFKDPKKK